MIGSITLKLTSWPETMNRRCHRAEELHSFPLPGDNCRIIWTYDLFCTLQRFRSPPWAQWESRHILCFRSGLIFRFLDALMISDMESLLSCSGIHVHYVLSCFLDHSVLRMEDMSLLMVAMNKKRINILMTVRVSSLVSMAETSYGQTPQFMKRVK